MSELDIIKGINTLKILSQNISSMIDFIENNHIEPLIAYIKELQNGCSVLTDIFEKAFFEMIAEKERMEDDGK